MKGKVPYYLNEDDLFFVSGDYSAATDGLSINFTKKSFERILEYFPEVEDNIKNAFRANLYE